MVSGSVDEFIQSKPPNTDATCPSTLPSVASSTPQPAVKPNPSPATRIWFAVVALVLAALWFNTQTPTESVNFFVEGNNDSEGAEVRIDGSRAGDMQRADQNGVRIVALRCKVSDGKHTIEVIKPGFSSFKTTVNVHGEDYVNVRLTP